MHFFSYVEALKRGLFSCVKYVQPELYSILKEDDGVALGNFILLVANF